MIQNQRVKTVRAAALLLIFVIVPVFFALRAQLAVPEVITPPAEPSEDVLPSFDGAVARYGTGQLTRVDTRPESRRWLLGSTSGIIEPFQTGAPVVATAFSPDDEDYAFALPNAVVIYHDDEDRLTSHEGLHAPVAALAWRPGTEELTIAFATGEIATLDTDSGTQRHYVWAGAPIFDVDWSPDGKLFATGTAAGTDSSVLIWEAQAESRSMTLTGHSNTVRQVDFSPDGRTLASGSDDSSIILWDVETGEAREQLDDHLTFITDLGFTAAGDHLLSGSFDGTVYRWNPETGEQTASVTFDAEGIVSVDEWYQFGDGTVVIATTENRLIITNFDTGETSELLGQFVGPIQSVAAFAEPAQSDAETSAVIAVGEKDGTLNLLTASSFGEFWDIAQLAEPLKGHHRASIEGLAFTPDGQVVVSVSGLSNGSDYAGKFVRLNEPDAGGDALFTGLHALDFSADNAILATSTGTTIDVYIPGNMGRGPIRRFQGHTALVLEVALTRDAATLASVSQDGSLRVWDTLERQLRHEFRGFAQDTVTSVDFSADDALLAVGSLGRVDVVDPVDGSLVQMLEISRAPIVTDVEFNADGLLAASTNDGRIFVWDTETYTLLHEFEGHAAGVNSIAWVGSSHIVSGSSDAMLILWQVETP